MSAIDLELSIRRSGISYVLDASLTQPGSEVESVLVADAPVFLDPSALLPLALDPAAYGQTLTTQLFSTPVRDAWGRACAYAEGAGCPLRLRLRIDTSIEELHAVRWETLRDPLNDVPLGYNARRLLVRYIPSADLAAITPGPRPTLHALVVVASPRNLNAYSLTDINIDEEVARLRAALGSIPCTIIGQHPNARQPYATLSAVRESLRAGPTLFCLICHGRQMNGESILYLESDDGTVAPTRGSKLVETLAQSDQRPLLVLLAACATGGMSHEPGALAALGPQIARYGSGAVIAMQGKFSMQSANVFLPTLLTEVAADGAIDRAVAIARAAIQEAHDWWVPALWLRMRDGRLWEAPPPESPKIAAPDHSASVDEQMLSRPLLVSPLTPQEQRYRRLTLPQVRAPVEERLRVRLDGTVPLEVRLTWQANPTPERRTSANRLASPSPTRPPAAPAGIYEAFKEAQGFLLVLGTAGAGKSTLLLMLCQALLDQAERDVVAHIPVMFDLNSWLGPDQPLASWMAGQLTSRAYNLTPDRAQELIESDAIIPLLDGLDEVSVPLRGACVAAINNYRDDHYTPLVVAIRADDYALLTDRLNLQWAVLVEPLTDTQIRTTLQAGGHPGHELLAAIESDSELHDLLRNPLLLQLALQARLSSLPGAKQAVWRVSSVLNSYITRMFQERGPARLQEREQMLSRLRWMAQRLRSHNQRVFYVEHIQPSDISRGWARTLYSFTARLLLALALVVATIAANLLALAAALVLLYAFSPAPAAMLPLLKIATLTSLIILAFFSFFLLLTGGASSQDRIHIVTRLRWAPAAIKAAVQDEVQTLVQLPWRKVIAPILIILIVVLGCGALSGQLLMFTGFCIALIIGVPASAALSGVIRGLCDDDVLRLQRPSEGITASAKTSGLVWLISVLVLGGATLISVLGSTLPSSTEGLVINTFLGVALIIWFGIVPALTFGGQVVIKHTAVRLSLWLSIGLPLRLSSFLDECARLALLRHVGGGYEFPHSILLEHIADLEDADIAHLASKLQTE
ncbi:MAG: CHAT domain-containing protein [Chloroflexales bacterium]